MPKSATSNFLSQPVARFGLLIVGVLVVATLSICVGTVPLNPKTVILSLSNAADVDPVLKQIILDFRMPRVLTALLAGAALATSGLMMQTIFRNPLADPFVLGVQSGASLGVALVVLAITPIGIQLTANLDASGQLLLILASSSGAAVALFTVLFLSRRADVVSMLIIGLMISYAIGAIVSILIFLSMAEHVKSFLSWSFGSYSAVDWAYLSTLAPVIIVALGTSILLAKPLDAFLLGERYAESMGVCIKRDRIVILLIASVLAGTVTGFCGPIGFLGIAAPHLSRGLFKTSNHRTLIPASILIGALLSMSADCIAQGPGLEVSLPLNAITALFGAPIIILVLLRQKTLRHTFA